MAAFKLTLTKIDTGDVLVDEEIDCLIGGAAVGDDTTCKLLFAECSPLVTAAANVAAHQTIEKLETESPVVKHLTALVLETDAAKKEREQE